MRFTWRIETIVLPELNHIVLQTTRKIVNRLSRQREIHLDHVVSQRHTTIEGRESLGRNLYLLDARTKSLTTQIVSEINL